MTGRGPYECRHLSRPDLLPPPTIPYRATLPPSTTPAAAKKRLTHPAAGPEHPPCQQEASRGDRAEGAERQGQHFLFMAAATVLPAAGILAIVAAQLAHFWCIVTTWSLLRDFLCKESSPWERRWPFRSDTGPELRELGLGRQFLEPPSKAGRPPFTHCAHCGLTHRVRAVLGLRPYMLRHQGRAGGAPAWGYQD